MSFIGQKVSFIYIPVSFWIYNQRKFQNISLGVIHWKYRYLPLWKLLEEHKVTCKICKRCKAHFYFRSEFYKYTYRSLPKYRQKNKKRSNKTQPYPTVKNKLLRGVKYTAKSQKYASERIFNKLPELRKYKILHVFTLFPYISQIPTFLIKGEYWKIYKSRLKEEPLDAHWNCNPAHLLFRSIIKSSISG